MNVGAAAGERAAEAAANQIADQGGAVGEEDGDRAGGVAALQRDDLAVDPVGAEVEAGLDDDVRLDGAEVRVFTDSDGTGPPGAYVKVEDRVLLRERKMRRGNT